MTRLIQSLSEILGPYRSILCGLRGVLVEDGRAIPGAAEALAAFRDGGGKVVLLTNLPLPKAQCEAVLAAAGIPERAYDGIASAGRAARDALAGGAVGRKIHHIGPEADRILFDDLPGGAEMRLVPVAEAEGIVCTGLPAAPEADRATLLEGRTRGLKMLCADPDPAVLLDGARHPGPGALAAEYESQGGEVLWIGKPHPQVYDFARRLLGDAGGSLQEADILAIGDGIGTDIQGGMQEGFDTLYVTGGVDRAAFGTDPATPDPARLDAFLREKMLSVTAAIPRLR